MKTRTLLLLSVGIGLMILLAGGVLLLQLSRAESTTTPTAIGTMTNIGDLEVTVFDSETTGGVLRVDVQIGGLDDLDGIDSFRLVTGDLRLGPLQGKAEGRCSAITVASQRCTVDFDVSAAESSNRVLVVRRGEEQSTWRL